MKDKLLCCGAYSLLGIALWFGHTCFRLGLDTFKEMGFGMVLPARIFLGIDDILWYYHFIYLPFILAGLSLASCWCRLPRWVDWLMIKTRTACMLLYGFAVGVLLMSLGIFSFWLSANQLPTAVGSR